MMYRNTAIVFAAIVAVFGFFVAVRTEVRPLDFNAPAADIVLHWEEQIRRDGGNRAYEQFAHAVSALSFEAKHQHAHYFGNALFHAEGAAGLSVCDARFSFGCFHEFLGQAITALGIESIPDLNDGCFKALDKSPLSCQHGIGHGALAAFGYDDEALRKALDVCRTLKRNDPIGGCYGGVFMEYNLRTMLGSAAQARAYATNPYTPCDILDPAYITACIYWQPQWWMQEVLAGMSEVEMFKSMGDYCHDFAKTPERTRACFEGLGNVVAQASDFDETNAREYCDAVSELSNERLLCRSIAANHFGIDVGADAAARVCDGLPGEGRTYCLAYASNQANVAAPLEL